MTMLTNAIAITAFAAGAALGAGFQQMRISNAQASHAQAMKIIAEQSEAATLAARKYEQQLTAAIEKEAQDGQDRLQAAQRDAVAARASANGLRAQLTSYIASARAQGACVTTIGAPTADALDLLTQLFWRADDRAGELAAYADSARAAGVTCERAYDSLTQER